MTLSLTMRAEPMRDTEGCHDVGDGGDDDDGCDGDGNEKDNYYMDDDNNGNAENRNDNLLLCG